MIYIIKHEEWNYKPCFYTRDFDEYENFEELKFDWPEHAEFREVNMDYEDAMDMDQYELEELFNSSRKYEQ